MSSPIQAFAERLKAALEDFFASQCGTVLGASRAARSQRLPASIAGAAWTTQSEPPGVVWDRRYNERKMPPAKNLDLHGNAPDSARAVLLMVDVINDMEYEGGDKLLTQALPMAERLADLKRRAKATGVPAIYANDNFGRWQSDFASQVRHCTEDPVRGRAVARRLPPEDDDYFVLKPKHSAFFATPLETLLSYLGADTLILAGIATDSCVLFTAADAFLRDYDLIVVADCVAAAEPERHREALEYMARVMKVRVTDSGSIDLAPLARPRGSVIRGARSDAPTQGAVAAVDGGGRRHRPRQPAG